MPPVRAFAISLLAASIGVSASAQNLLINPDFAVGVGFSGWNFSTGTFSLGPDSTSCSLSNSAEALAGNVNGNYFVQLYSTQCIPVDPSSTPILWLGAMVSSSVEVYARLYLSAFSDADCETHATFSDFAYTTSSPTWSSILDPVTVPAGAASVRLGADLIPPINGMPQYTGAFDQFYVGTVPLVFADGFEAEGSVCSWSSAAGAS
jgi:hypothetical protein